MAVTEDNSGSFGMHTVDLLARTIEAAEELGYGVRREWLGGVGGGLCEFGGRKWIFIDLALNVVEQLEQVAAALRHDPACSRLPLAPAVAQVVELRRAA